MDNRFFFLYVNKFFPCLDMYSFCVTPTSHITKFKFSQTNKQPASSRSFLDDQRLEEN